MMPVEANSLYLLTVANKSTAHSRAIVGPALSQVGRRAREQGEEVAEDANQSTPFRYPPLSRGLGDAVLADIVLHVVQPKTKMVPIGPLEVVCTCQHPSANQHRRNASKAA
jgi:hypothetical protein